MHCPHCGALNDGQTNITSENNHIPVQRHYVFIAVNMVFSIKTKVDFIFVDPRPWKNLN